MPTRTTANLTQSLTEEELSNKTLRKNLATALRTQLKQDKELIELRKQVRVLNDCLKGTRAQIDDKDEELLQLHTQVVALTKCLKKKRQEIADQHKDLLKLRAEIERARCLCQGGSGVRRCKKRGKSQMTLRSAKSHRKVTDNSD